MASLLFLVFLSSAVLAENHVQSGDLVISRPTMIRVQPTGNQTLTVQADGAHVELKGSIPSAPKATFNIEAQPYQCEVNYRATKTSSEVTGVVSLQSRAIPIAAQARGLNGRTDTVSKTILGGEVGVYGVVQDVEFKGSLNITKAEGRLTGSLEKGILVTFVIEGNTFGSAVARGTTEAWVKRSHRSVRQIGYFDVKHATFREAFSAKVNCVNSKLQIAVPVSDPHVDVRAKVDLRRTRLNPMFELGSRFPNLSSQIRDSLLVKYEPTINQKLNNKLKLFLATGSDAYLQFKRGLVQQVLASDWLDQVRAACACGVNSLVR